MFVPLYYITGIMGFLIRPDGNQDSFGPKGGISLILSGHYCYFLYINFFLIFIHNILQSIEMDCRPGCGACCIALSISSPIPGMHDGKPAGVRCIHLLEDFRCALYNSPLRPQVCINFMPDPEFCGNSREEAMRIMGEMEKAVGSRQ